MKYKMQDRQRGANHHESVIPDRLILWKQELPIDYKI